MANLGDAEAAPKRSPLRRLLAVDELGIFVATVLFFIIGALKQPVFRNRQQPDRHPSEHNVPRLPLDRRWTCR